MRPKAIRVLLPVAGSPGRTAYITWRRGIGRVLSVAMLCFFLLAPEPSKAGEITFNDSSDTLTVTTDSSQTQARLTAFCEGELCSVELGPPPGGFQLISTPGQPLSFWIAEFNNPSQLSDELDLDESSGDVLIDFTSDEPGSGEISNLGPCSATQIGSCNLTEDGTVQSPATLLWMNSTGQTVTDTISFQSDVDSSVVPEPGSLILLGSGLVAVGGFLRRRRQQ